MKGRPYPLPSAALRDEMYELKAILADDESQAVEEDQIAGGGGRVKVVINDQE